VLGCEAEHARLIVDVDRREVEIGRARRDLALPFVSRAALEVRYFHDQPLAKIQLLGVLVSGLACEACPRGRCRASRLMGNRSRVRTSMTRCPSTATLQRKSTSPSALRLRDG